MLALILAISVALAEPVTADVAVDVPLTLGAGSLWLALYTQPERQTVEATSAPPGGLDGLAPTTLSEGPATVSDVVLYGGLVTGLGLGLVHEGRAGRTLLFAEALSVTGALTELTKHAVRRPRPYTFGGTSVDADDDRSFFSGHTSFVATASLFVARSWDLERDLGPGGRALAYGLAGGLTVGTAALRVTAGKHFPSDVLVGGLVGGAVGWLVPELHREGRVRVAVGPRGVSLAGPW